MRLTWIPSKYQWLSCRNICVCVYTTTDRQCSVDSQVLVEQIDDVFISQVSAVTVGDELGDAGTAASKSDATLSNDDTALDQDG